MPAAAPLQIILLRHQDDQEVTRYENAVIRAFQGEKRQRSIWRQARISESKWKVFTDTPLRQARLTCLDAFCHTLTVVFVDRALLDKSSAPFWDWLVQCWTHTDASNERHAMLAVAMDERIGRAFTQKRNELETIQLLQTLRSGEFAIRPAMLALRILHECRLLVSDRAAGRPMAIEQVICGSSLATQKWTACLWRMR